MIFPGLVSITFRSLTPREIIDLITQARLRAVEWGGDIHVPHGAIDQARAVRRMCEDAELSVAAYGSYYRVGHTGSALNAPESDGGTPVPFEAVIETAVELGTSQIRVWAGKKGTEQEDEAYFEQVVHDSVRIAKLAAAADVRIAYEYHGNTLTDTDDAARRLLETVNVDTANLDTANLEAEDSASTDAPTICSYWQPRRCGTVKNDLAGIAAVSPWLTDVHVFSWHPMTGARLPLAERADDWAAYLEQIRKLPGNRFALLEFVEDDNPISFFRDAETLNQWLSD